MSPDPQVFLEDMIVACTKIERYAADLDFDSFRADERTLDAVVLNLIILGEAAKQIPETFRENNPAVEWRGIAGLRDVVVHRYVGWDEEILWDVVRRHIPRLHE